MPTKPKMIYPSIESVIAKEGGYIDDPLGGPTNMGITLGTLKRYCRDESLEAKDVKNLTVHAARRIYLDEYLVRPGFNNIEERWLRGQVVDAGVLHGTGMAKKWLQEVAGVKVDYDIGPITLRAINKIDTQASRILNNAFAVKRIIYMGAITQEDPKKKLPFLEGWLIRAAAFIR